MGMDVFGVTDLRGGRQSGIGAFQPFFGQKRQLGISWDQLDNLHKDRLGASGDVELDGGM